MCRAYFHLIVKHGFSFGEKGNIRGVKGKLKKVMWGILIAGLLCVFAVGGAVAAYQINSNHITTITVHQRPGLTLTASTTDVMEGNTITFAATLSDQANSVLITLYDGSTQVDQKSSAGGGIATFAVTATMGTHDYWAQAAHP
jgi:hypothetical protein